MKFLSKAFLFALILGGAGCWYTYKQVVGEGPLVEDSFVEIAKGASSQQVAHQLYQQHVISNPYLFRGLIKYQQADGQIKAGEYQFSSRVSMLSVLDKLVKGDVLFHRITIPEGYTVGQILKLLEAEPILSGSVAGDVQEGSIFPETYTFSKGESRISLLKKAQAIMSNKLREIWDARADNLPYQNMQELLTMASIIEKETGVDDERTKVASVFVNRLRKGMLLQTDPTVIYALTKGKEDLGRLLTRKDLAFDDPYNTYVYAGLPPTPICNPGEDSLWAAAHPEETEYLYFVANGLGGHNFAKTLTEHNRNVADWKKVR